MMREYFNRLYCDSADSFYQSLYSSVRGGERRFIVTANPETFMVAQKNPDLDNLLCKETTTVVPDGIGIVKAAHYLSVPVKDKITGVDIAANLLKDADQLHKSVYFYGAKEEVLQQLLKTISVKYPGLVVAGFHNGYNGYDDAVFEDIVGKRPDIVMVALGIPRQELLIDRYFNRFSSGIFIGVGGSFDVLSGSKKRAPQFFVKRNMEWLYRIVREPKRLGRFYTSNIRFLFAVRKIKRQEGKAHSSSV